MKSLIAHGLIISLIAFFFSLVFSLIAGEYVIKHLFPQNTYSLAQIVGLHIFEEGKNIPFTLKSNVNKFHHIGYTREFDHLVSTNSQGTRGPEFQIQKPENTFRILLLGDSMTFGWGVEDNETYASLLAENLNTWARKSNISTNFEVINAGFTDGKSLDSYYVYLKEKGLNFNPDLVIMDFFPYNDVSDIAENNWEKTGSGGLPEKISSKIEKIENGYMVKRQKTNWMFEIPVLRNSNLAILLFSAMEKGSPALVTKIKDKLNVVEDKPKYSPQEVMDCLGKLEPKYCIGGLLENYQKIKELTKGISTLTEKNNKQFLITLMSEAKQAVPISKKEDQKSALSPIQPQKDMKEFLVSEKIDYYDFLEILAKPNANTFFYERDGHLNRVGHSQIAKGLSVFIAQKYFPKITIDPSFLEQGNSVPQI